MRSLKETHLLTEEMWNKLKHFDGHYLWPSQDTWCNWLTVRVGWRPHVRTINRWFSRAEKTGHLMRIRRVKRDPIKGHIFLTTLYALSFSGLIYLVKKGMMTWAQLREYLKNSKPFRARTPKKEKKGLTPDDKDFYRDFTNLGSVVGALIK